MYKAAKYVTATTFRPLHGDMVFEVGQTYSLPPQARLEMCAVGFHMCAHPLQPFVGGYGYDARVDALLRVRVEPTTADEVLADPEGDKLCVRSFTVLACLSPAEKWALVGGEVRRVTASATRWYSGAVLHRAGDLPAYVSASGDTQKWYHLGELHREGDRPAIVATTPKGVVARYWLRHGRLHRDGDLPAVDLGTGADFEWWVDGCLHRDWDDQPAVVSAAGSIMQWWVRGKLVRCEPPQPPDIVTEVM